MNDREAIQKLKELGKEYRKQLDPSSEEVERMFSRFVSETAAHKITPSPEKSRVFSSVRTAFAFPRVMLPKPVFVTARGVGALAILLVVAFGGWTATASAFPEMIPGHPFYGVKRATEKARLTFAVSKEAKARLAMEIAGNRLDEAAMLLGSESPDREARIKQAVDEFAEGVSAAQEELRVLGEKNGGRAIETARTLDRKASAYGAVLQKAGQEASTDAQDEVAEAKEAVSDISMAAVEVLVEAGVEDVKSVVEVKMRELENLLQVTAVQLSNLPSGPYPEVEELAGPGLRELLDELKQARRVLEEGKNLLARGGYEAALEDFGEGFEIVNQVDAGIGLYESVLAGREAEDKEGFSLPIFRQQ